MNGAAIVLAMATLGVDVGWQELEDGSIEYIIQIEPQLVGSLKDGHDLTSGVRPELRNIRRYRVVVGSEDLPQNPPLAELKRRMTADEAAKQGAPAFGEPKVPRAFAPPPAEPLAGEDRASAPPKFTNPFGALNGAPKFDAPKFDAPEATPAEEETKAEEPKPAAAEPEAAKSEDRASIPPPTFTPDDSEKPIIPHLASYGEAADPAAPANEQQESAAASETPARSWGVLTAVMLALFASLGLNAFLGWVTVEQRGRYRSLLARNNPADAA